MVDPSQTRVLFFAHETTWSGAAIQLLHLITWLKGRGYQMTVAAPQPATAECGPISAELVRRGVETLPILNLSGEPDLAALRSLCAQFDVVIANTLVMWAAVRAAFEEGTPVIWYIHESLVAEQLIAQVPEIRPALQLADIVVVPAGRTAKLYTSRTTRPIEVVPYGIPPADMTPKRRMRDAMRKRFLLLGTYEPRKGQDLYLDAIAQLGAAAHPSALFQMAGRILDREFYQNLARQAALVPNVELLNALDHDQALEAIAAADVLVCASRDETMPIAILEAMNLGKAIVSARVGGVTEWLVHGANALLMPSGDAAALAEVLLRCLEERNLTNSLGREARRTFLKNFTLDRLGERFTALIRRVRSGREQ
jgi:glycosyltransferase involved in cell wall biosynthesis